MTNAIMVDLETLDGDYTMPKARYASESRVKAEVKEVLNELGAWHFMPVQSGYGTKGVPDHLACIPLTIRPEHVGQTMGIFVGVETKTLVGEETPFQRIQLDRIVEAGGGAYIVKGVRKEDGNFAEFERLLKSIFKGVQ